jgi:hypothetical protein
MCKFLSTLSTKANKSITLDNLSNNTEIVFKLYIRYICETKLYRLNKIIIQVTSFVVSFRNSCYESKLSSIVHMNASWKNLKKLRLP